MHSKQDCSILSITGFPTYRIVNMGYMMGSLFIRSLEQGERHMQACSAGYGRDSYIFIRKKPLVWSDLIFLGLCLLIIILVPIFSGMTCSLL